MPRVDKRRRVAKNQSTIELDKIVGRRNRIARTMVIARGEGVPRSLSMK